MPNLAEVKRQIAALPHSYIFWTWKEIHALPGILDEDEVITGVTSGFQNGSTWLGICTPKRVIFLNYGMFYGAEQVQMPLDRVQSVDNQFTIVFGSISVFDGINVFRLDMVLKSSIMPFVKAVQEGIYKNRRPAAAAEAPTALDVASQLSKLADLKERGHLTEEEFQAQKRKLLG